MNVRAGSTYRHKTRGYIAAVEGVGLDHIAFRVTDPSDKGWSNRTTTSLRYFAANYEPAA